MTIQIIILVFILSTVYAYLIYKLIKVNQFRKPIISVTSVFLMFVLVHFVFDKNMGYPIHNNLPDTFELLHFHKSENNIIMLITSFDQNQPRLHSLDYDIKLEELLTEALDSKRSGKSLLGVMKKNKLNGIPNITFREIKRNLPMK